MRTGHTVSRERLCHGSPGRAVPFRASLPACLGLQRHVSRGGLPRPPRSGLTHVSGGLGRPPGAKQWRSGAVGLAAAVLAAALLVSPALGWSDRGHHLITEEAVGRLPEPLRGLLAAGTALERLKQASAAPDTWRKRESPHYRPDEKPRHFFDIDAMTDESYPFAGFPRDRADAEKRFGPQVFQEHGSAPWAAADALGRLTDAMATGRTADIFHDAGEMAHYAADLHMPFHTTKNYDGKLTGNHGIHKTLEIGLVHRRLDFYKAEMAKARREVTFVDDARDRLFDWLIEAHSRVKPILEADTAARREAKYNPAQHPEDADDLASARARPYYDALKRELAARGSPEAVAMRDAAAHLADLLYTAWVRAGKPLTLSAAPLAAPRKQSRVEYLLIGAAVVIFLLMLLPRRRPARPGGAGSTGSGPPP